MFFYIKQSKNILLSSILSCRKNGIETQYKILGNKYRKLFISTDGGIIIGKLKRAILLPI